MWPLNLAEVFWSTITLHVWVKIPIIIHRLIFKVLQKNFYPGALDVSQRLEVVERWLGLFEQFRVFR
jgi:hypothetical protein